VYGCRPLYRLPHHFVPAASCTRCGDGDADGGGDGDGGRSRDPGADVLISNKCKLNALTAPPPAALHIHQDVFTVLSLYSWQSTKGSRLPGNIVFLGGHPPHAEKIVCLRFAALKKIVGL